MVMHGNMKLLNKYELSGLDALTFAILLSLFRSLYQGSIKLSNIYVEILFMQLAVLS